jgi:protein BCP1
LQLETVQADFAFFDPKPSDFHGVRLLLKTYLDSKPWDLTGFVDLILAQTTVGTVVKLADDDDEEGEGNGAEKANSSNNTDDDDLFGLISVLNLGRHAVCFAHPGSIYDQDVRFSSVDAHVISLCC